jgi:hypothetical protein
MRLGKVLAAASVGLAALGVIGYGSAYAANAALTMVTATTHIQNDPDSGGSGFWASDNLDRTVTVTAVADPTLPAGFTRYTGLIVDKGTFTTLPGAFTPNQVIPGQKIAHVVSGTLTGAATYDIVAPSADLLVDNYQANINDGGSAPASPFNVSGWPLQAFTSSAGVTVTLKTWGWQYVTKAGESWTDSSATGNNDGQAVSDGNITGLLAPVVKPIRLSHGFANSTAPTRETVCFTQSAPSWDEFVIIGPGAINGHKGWIYAQAGLNCGYYSGLLAGHGYTSDYTPVTARGSEQQVAGSHGGYVYFVSNR